MKAASNPMALKVLAFLGGILAYGCGPNPAPEAPPVRPVYWHDVEIASPTVTRSFSGVVAASTAVDLGFEVGGRIVAIEAEAGRHYDAGTVLARIDSTGYQADLKNAMAQFAAADAALKRTLRLYETDNASKSQLDSAIASQEAAQANLDVARKRLEDCTLHMPYDGVIGAVIADAQLVVAPGAPVLSVQGTGLPEMEIGVPADIVDQVELGQTATVRIGAFPERAYPARVTEISAQIAANTTYPVTVTFNEAHAGVRAGLDGEAKLDLRNPHGSVVAVPSSCVAGGSDTGGFVWVVTAADEPEFAKVSKRAVKLGGIREGGRLEIVSGLSGGERIVARGVNRLREGQLVRLSSAAQD